MKKNISFLIVIFLFHTALMFIGCGNESGPSLDESEQETTKNLEGVQAELAHFTLAKDGVDYKITQGQSGEKTYEFLQHIVIFPIAFRNGEHTDELLMKVNDGGNYMIVRPTPKTVKRLLARVIEKGFPYQENWN